MKIQGLINFGKNEVIVSVGYLRGRSLNSLCERITPEYIEAYEPQRAVYAEYADIKYPVFKAVYGAVLSHSGTVLLNGKGTNAGVLLSQEGNIPAFALSPILQRIHRKYGRIDRLLLNCEGSEYDIIQNTPIEDIALARFVFIQFHHWLPFVKNDQADTRRMLLKMEKRFRCTPRNRKYAKYTFVRR